MGTRVPSRVRPKTKQVGYPGTYPSTTKITTLCTRALQCTLEVPRYLPEYDKKNRLGTRVPQSRVDMCLVEDTQLWRYPGTYLSTIPGYPRVLVGDILWRYPSTYPRTTKTTRLGLYPGTPEYLYVIPDRTHPCV